MATVSGIEVKEIGEMVGRGGEPRMHGELYRNGKPFLSFADDLNSIGVTTLNGPDENKKSFAEIAKQDIPKLGLKGMDEFAFINVLMTLDYFETAFMLWRLKHLGLDTEYKREIFLGCKVDEYFAAKTSKRSCFGGGTLRQNNYF